MYSAVLVAPDGAWTVDYHSETIEGIHEALCNQGSRWYFYPFHAVIRDHPITRKTNRLVDVAEPFEFLKGKTIGTFAEIIAGLSENELRAILGA